MSLNESLSSEELPLIIILTRIAPRSYDDDNLVSAFKHIRDAIADIITPGLAPGRADDINGLTFAYSQEKGYPKEYSVKIEIIPTGLNSA